MPIKASSSATAENRVSSCANKRGRPIDSVKTLSISRRRATGTVGSTSRTTRSIVGARVTSGSVVLTTTCIIVGENATQVVGESVASWSTSR